MLASGHQGIQDNPDPIVIVGYAVTFTETCQDLVRVTIVCADTEVDRFISVEYPDLCGLRGLNPFDGNVLSKAPKNRSRSPCLFIQKTVDVDSWID